jgi:DNA-binding MurR/RpiR family transcriptional regulator
MSSAPLLFDHKAVGELSPELLRAARWIEQHPRDVALNSMRECARRAGLAPASFTRLAHAIGSGGFEAIRARCQEALAPQAGYAARAQALQATAKRSAHWLDNLNEAQHANTASISGLNERAQFEQAADAMLASNQVHFLGLRASHGLAFHLHYTYGLVAANGVLVQGLGGTLTDQLAQLHPKDLLVAISQSPYTRQTVEAVEQARQQGATVLALTDSRLSPIARSADLVLLFRAESPSYFNSMVGALALAEAVVAAVAVRGGRKVLGRLASMQQKLDAQGAYWARRESAPLRSARKEIKS